jgi:DENN domain-containing protein 1
VQVPRPVPASKHSRKCNFFAISTNKLFLIGVICLQRNLTEYYSAVDAQNMMIIFASMLYERRIIFTSKRLSRLSACVQAANAVLYPMNWQHIFIPVLPVALVDYLLAPMPFLIGVPTPVLQVWI